MAKVINKVVYNNNTLIDLTQDTVTASKLAQGYTAHSASGAQITGTMPEGGGGEYDIEGTTLASGGQQLDITDAGTAITVEPITITQNGTTTAPSGKAYSPITTNVPQTTINSLSVTENGTYTAPTGTAYSPVTVNVSGGGGASGVLKANIDANGAVTIATSLDVSNITSIGQNSLAYWQNTNSSLTGTLNFSSLLSIGGGGLGSAFSSTKITSALFPVLTTVGITGLNYAFRATTTLTTVTFTSLTTIQSMALNACFNGCTGLTSISFPALTSIGANGLGGSSALCFNGCTNLTAIHFKSSMQSAVQAVTGYSSKFGASNATIYFDLP